ELQALLPLGYEAPFASVPMIYHASAREFPLEEPEIAVPLYRLFRGDGSFPFSKADQMRDALLLGRTSKLLASGVAKDKEVERWWGLELPGRLAAIRNLKTI